MTAPFEAEILALLQEKPAETLMDLALREAGRALDVDEVPVGAVIVDIPTGRLVAKSHNQRELLQDSTAHAEMLAITQAAAHYESWRLTRAALFVTLEPCAMCAGAIILARIPYVFYGARDPKWGAHCSLHDVLENPANNHVPCVTSGVRVDECARLLTDFFRRKRQPSAKDNGSAHNGNDGPKLV